MSHVTVAAAGNTGRFWAHAGPGEIVQIAGAGRALPGASYLAAVVGRPWLGAVLGIQLVESRILLGNGGLPCRA